MREYLSFYSYLGRISSLLFGSIQQVARFFFVFRPSIGDFGSDIVSPVAIVVVVSVVAAVCGTTAARKSRVKVFEI